MNSKIIDYIGEMVDGIKKSEQYTLEFYENISIDVKQVFKLSEWGVRKHRDEYFRDKQMALYWFLNGKELLDYAKDYESKLVKKGIPINDDLFLKMLDKANNIEVNTEDSYKAFFVLDFISEKLS
jgi:hypothetical protein|tara:strand:- start:20488 stop:20862 length:375 start_codon:yes stop_codon:yes gene_type:complete